jgi:hypothetical protein
LVSSDAEAEAVADATASTIRTGHAHELFILNTDSQDNFAAVQMKHNHATRDSGDIII